MPFSPLLELPYCGRKVGHPAARVSALIEEATGVYVPVIDPNHAGFSFLVSLARMRVRPSRLTYSKVAAGD